MGSLRVYVLFMGIVGMLLLCSQAAPMMEIFGPPKTIEHPKHERNQPSIKNIQDIERFHRTYDNGTVEFKMVLSNGHIQYQKIIPKIVGGHMVRAYEGYFSEQVKDGRFRTRYYAADENGYRSSPVLLENEPPELPSSGPYRTSLSTDNDVDTESKTQVNTVEEEQSTKLNLDTNNVPTTESTVLIQEKKQDPSTSQLPLCLDLPSSTELPSTSAPQHPTLQNDSGADIPESGTEKPVEKEEIADIKKTREELRNTDQSIVGVSETTLGTILNDELTSPEVPSSASLSPLPEYTGVQTDGQTSIVSQYPQEEAGLESTTLPSTDDILKSIGEDVSSSSGDLSTSSPVFDVELPTVTTHSSVGLKLGTEKAISITTETPLNDEVATTEQPAFPLNNNPSSSALPEQNTVSQIHLENNGSDDTQTDSSLQTSSLAPEIENENKINTEASTTVPKESLTNIEDKISRNIPNDQESFVKEKEGRGFDFLKFFTFSKNNETSSSEDKEEKNSSTEKIGASANVSIPTTTPTSDSTTESENISTTTEEDGIAKVEEITQSDDTASTDQPTTVETTSGEMKGKSLEIVTTTELSEASDGEQTTEAEVMSTTEETKVKTYGESEVEFAPPVIHF